MALSGRTRIVDRCVRKAGHNDPRSCFAARRDPPGGPARPARRPGATRQAAPRDPWLAQKAGATSAQVELSYCLSTTPS